MNSGSTPQVDDTFLQNPVAYTDPCRNIQRYLEEKFGVCWPEDPICGTNHPNCPNPEPHDPITTFMLLAINQAKGNWDERLTAARVNCYMRAGFDIPEPCPADLDDDGSVGVNDLLILLGCWGPVGSGCEGADLNGDGDVGVADLLILLGSWGPCETCEPQALTAQEQDCLDTYEPGTPELKDCLEHVRDHGTFWEGGGDPEM